MADMTDSAMGEIDIAQGRVRRPSPPDTPHIPPAPVLTEDERDGLVRWVAGYVMSSLGGYRQLPPFMAWFEAVLPAASPPEDQ